MTLKLGVGVVQGHWKWRRSIDHIGLFIGPPLYICIALSGTVLEPLDVEEYRDLEIWIRGHSRSFKLVPFETLVVVPYSPSIVTMAVSLAISEIFSVKEWPDLEIWVIENGAVR